MLPYRFALLACSGALLASGFAFAQVVPSLAEVQVSADQPAEVNQTPLAASKATLDGATLQERGLRSLSEASMQVPGLYSFGTTPRLIGFSIRGIGNNQFNDGLDSSVGLYTDGVYLARQSYAAFGLFDLESVTVMRGPQGARYGLGSTAGEVLINTQMPSHMPSTNLSVGAGQNRARLLELSSTGSIVPGELAGRLSVFTQSRDGHLFNRFDGTKLNDLNRQAVRGQLLWTPRDDLLVRVIGEYGDLNQRCCAIGLLGPVSASIQASDDYMGYERPGTNPADREIDNNVDPLTRLRREAASVVVEWGPTGRHRFVSVTGVNQLRFDPARNDDGTSMNLVEGSTTTQSRQISQELRMHTRFHRMDTTLGIIAVQQDVKGREVGVLGDEIALWALGGALRQQVPTLNRQNSGFLINAVLPPQALNGLRLITPYQQDSLTTSLFGNTDWHLSPLSTLSAGLRYTESRRSGRVARTREGGNLNSSPLALTNQLAALGSVLGPDFQDLTYDGLIDSLVGESFDRTDSRKDSGASGQLGYQFRLGPQALAYTTLTRGYKSGGLNLAGLTPLVRPQFDAETVTALEVGLRGLEKSTGLSGGVALYRSRVKNFQALSYDEGDGLIRNPRQNNVLNIPVVDMAGIELDFMVPLSKKLLAGGGLAYNRAITTRFANAPNEDTGENNKDLSGKQLYNAPRWSGFASLEKRFALVAGLQPYVGVEHSFRSKTFGAVDQSRNSFIDAYQLTNLRVGVRGNNGQWNLQAFVNNAFDEDYIAAVSALYSVGDYGGFAGEPRTFGVRLDMTLGP